MDKTNYSVARVETYTKISITKAERHNERKNKSYSNINVDLEQTPNNVHYKRCETTYNEKLKEMLDSGQVSLRGLRANANLFDELIFDINSDYFEKHGGYEFAKEFYEKLSKMTKEERLQYFRDNYCNEQKLNFEKEINGTIYKVNTHFDVNAEESILNKFFRLTKKS